MLTLPDEYTLKLEHDATTGGKVQNKAEEGRETVPDQKVSIEKEPIKTPMESLPTVLQASGWGRKSNEKIAKAYSKQGLAQLSSMGEFLKTGFALYDAKRYEDALDAFKKMAEMAGHGKVDHAMALVWQGHMLDLLGRRDEAVGVYKKAADLNVDGVIQHDQYGIKYNLSTYPKERMKEPFTRVENRDEN